MTRSHWFAACLGAALLGGCSKDSAHETAAMADAGAAMGAVPDASAALPSAMASGSAAPEIEDTPPTERRAEGKAVSEITRANYKSELTKIEKELGSP